MEVSSCLKISSYNKALHTLNAKQTKNKKSNMINLVHQNIQCIKGKDLEIELFLNNFNIDILCVTEHWLKNHEYMFNFSDHQVGSSFTRSNAIHGGSLILLNKKFKFKNRNDIVSLSVERTIELSSVELEQFIVVSVYRPPLSNFELFEKVMDEVLFKLSKSNKKLIVCGDFNVNILESSSVSGKLLNLFKSYNLSNMFMEPTRITATSATCIDNIFTNFTPVNKNIISKLDSDHCGQLIQFENLNKNVFKRRITFVPVTLDRIEKIRTSLTQELPFLANGLSPNEMYNIFFNTFSEIFKSIFTSRTVLTTDANVFSEWATNELHRNRQKLYELYAERQYDTSDEFKQHVPLFSKKFKRDCIVAKSKHIQTKIKNSSNVIKTTWNIVNKETGRATRKNCEFKLNVGNTSVTSDSEVASVFEGFFTDIPVSTTESLNSSSNAALALLEDNVPECNNVFKFCHVNCSDIIKAFKLINNKKTNDLWDISVKVVKSLIDIVAPELALIFNNCIDCGEFPDLMKHSKIIPLFKSGSTSDPTNFRPISVLPTFSKIFEKLILIQLLKHFCNNDLLHSKQFGFTRGRSTTDAGVELIQNIFEAWEESRDALGVFCDLSKAFDCVDHETLVRKLHHYGIRGVALDMMNSYLKNRIQKVDVNGKRSSGSIVKMGVPQGSILGPFLFLIYINDLPYLAKDNHGIVLFADDTSLLFKINRYETTFDEVNNSLTKVVQWFEANNLLLNGKKTKCIKFTLPNVKQVKTTVQLDHEELDLVDTAVFLGITLDAKLQWGNHINDLSNRLSSAAYAVKKIRQLTDIETARLVYFAYFHSIMSYGILLWGNAADINSVFVLQKRAVRAIYNMGPRESLRDKFKEINIMTVHNQYIFENLVYVHKHIDQFKKKSDCHNVNTRNKNKLVMPASRLRKTSNSFVGNSVRFYNKLPEDMLKMSLNKFKVNVKRKLIEKSYYHVKDYLNDKEAWQ